MVGAARGHLREAPCRLYAQPRLSGLESFFRRVLRALHSLQPNDINHICLHYCKSVNDDTCLAQREWQPDDKWHALEITVQGNRIAARLDGQPLLDAIDRSRLGVPPIPAGGIALSARRWSQSTGHTRIAFDDIEVELLPD